MCPPNVSPFFAELGILAKIQEPRPALMDKSRAETATATPAGDMIDVENPLTPDWPFPLIEDSSIDLSNPIPEHQKLLKTAAQKAMEMVVKALNPPELPEIHFSPAVSPASAASSVPNTPPNSFTVTLQVHPFKDTTSHLIPEQHHVVSNALKFLYHVCRGQFTLIQEILLPYVKLIRSHVGTFPDAMLLLAELCRYSVKAARVRPKDVHGTMERHLVSSQPGSFRTQTSTLFCNILMVQPIILAEVDGGTPTDPENLAALQYTIVECVYNDLMGSSQVVDIIKCDNPDQMKGEAFGHAYAILALMVRCLHYLKKTHPLVSTSSSTISAAIFLGRILQMFKLDDCLTKSNEPKLPLPLRALFAEILSFASCHLNMLTAADAASAGGADLVLDLFSDFLENCRMNLACLRGQIEDHRVDIHDLDERAVTPFLLDALPRLLLQYLVQAIGPKTYSDLEEAVLRANKAIDNEQKRSRLRKTPELLRQKVLKALSYENSLTEWVRRIRSIEGHQLTRTPSPGHPIHKALSRRNTIIIEEARTIRSLLGLIEEMTTIVLDSSLLTARWGRTEQIPSSRLLYALVFATLCENHSRIKDTRPRGISASASAAPLPERKPEETPPADDQVQLPQQQFLCRLTHALLVRRYSEKRENEDADLLHTQLPALINDVETRVLNVYKPGPIEGMCLAFADIAPLPKPGQLPKGNIRQKRITTFRGVVSPHINAIISSDSILKRVLWRHFVSFMSFQKEHVPDTERATEDFRVWTRNGRSLRLIKCAACTCLD